MCPAIVGTCDGHVACAPPFLLAYTVLSESVLVLFRQEAGLSEASAPQLSDSEASVDVSLHGGTWPLGSHVRARAALIPDVWESGVSRQDRL